jgi:predicted dehydrogenase
VIPLRLAMVGAGWWATTVHLPAMARNPEIELVAVCDPSAERARTAASRFDVPRSYDDIGALLRRESESGGLDGVVVATPHNTHHPIVAAALEAGVHVLVEKPMTTRAADAWDLVDLAEERRRHLMVGLTYQFAPTAHRVQQAVRDQIGELVCVNAEFSSGTYRLFATADPTQADLDDPSVPHGTTYSDPGTGGGQGHTQLTHLLGGLLYAVQDQAVEVSGYMANRGLAVDVVDALAFRLGDGALGTASSTGTTPTGAPVRHQIRFHGTVGVVEWDLLRAEAWIHGAEGRTEHVENPVDQPAYHREQVSADFARLVRNGGINPAPADTAAASVSLIEAAYTAARTGRSTPVVQGRLRPVEATAQA